MLKTVKSFQCKFFGDEKYQLLAQLGHHRRHLDLVDHILQFPLS